MVNSFEQAMRVCGREDASPSWISVAGLLIGCGGDRGWWQLSELRFFLRYLAGVRRHSAARFCFRFPFFVHLVFVLASHSGNR